MAIIRNNWNNEKSTLFSKLKSFSSEICYFSYNIGEACVSFCYSLGNFCEACASFCYSLGFYCIIFPIQVIFDCILFIFFY